MRFIIYVVIYLLVGFFGLSNTLLACPLCKEAISTPGEGEEEEINNAPAAYNMSIYLMAGTPYLLLGGVGFFIYRGCQRNAEHRQRSEPDITAMDEGPPQG
jgi:hypothetical protein